MSTSALSTQVEPAPAAAPPRDDRSPARRRRDTIAGWAFVGPFTLLFLAFLVVPILLGLWQSFTSLSLTGANNTFVGLANYAEAFGDADMWNALGNTTVFTVLSTVPLVLVALVMALLVNMGIKGQWFWRLAFFLPFLLASTVVTLFWEWMYNPELGVINDVLTRFGAEPVSWLQDQNTAMGAVVVTTVWWTVGFNFLLYLAALQNIPHVQYEAAAIDGASAWRQLFSITLPQLGPTTVLIVILQVLASLKVFDQIYMMTQGGPAGATRSIVQYIYDTGFTGYRLGYAASISYIFFAIIVVLSLVQARIAVRRSS
ncbi:carbohydrate ABC transporter permease [Desertihabitans aurantiacus]|uniref:carbohydrate ABC transporter permease n=1 Tax=Desertihabitans aurantiacus TaxID=2282477 RepID=UPI000DF725ED|nr:sugar ABC transporter permease [Desertihabitans aurantiacus]